MKLTTGLIIGLFLGSCSIGYAGKIFSPPPFTEINPNLQHWLYDVYSNFQILTVTDTAPNGTRKGTKGEIIFYNNGGTFELYVNTDGATTWQKVDP